MSWYSPNYINEFIAHKAKEAREALNSERSVSGSLREQLTAAKAELAKVRQMARVDIEKLEAENEKARAEALEEAAKVVESGDFDGDTFDLLAAAIRALKSY